MHGQWLSTEYYIPTPVRYSQPSRTVRGTVLRTQKAYINAVSSPSRPERRIQTSPIAVIMSASIDPKVVESIPESVLAILPAATPPPGVLANFIDPPTRVPVLLGLGSTFLLIALLCYTVRIYTKVAIVKSWKWDDGK